MIKITIKTENAAFHGEDDHHDPGAEVARILRKLADQAESGTMRNPYDGNGNRVGSVTLTGRDSSLEL